MKALELANVISNCGHLHMTLVSEIANERISYRKRCSEIYVSYSRFKAKRSDCYCVGYTCCDNHVNCMYIYTMRQSDSIKFKHIFIFLDSRSSGD